MMKRLFATLLIFLTLVFHPCLGDEISSPPKTYDVVIVGGGTAGLAAANALREKHRQVLVLEARNRVGGRIWSVHPWGIGLDLGASWMHGIQNNPVADIVAKENIKTVATTYESEYFTKKLNDMILFDSNGHPYSKVDVDTLIPLVNSFIEFSDHLPNKENLSLEEALHLFNKQHPLKNSQANLFHYLIINVYVYEFAADLSQLSSQIDLAYEKPEVKGDNVIFPQGYVQFIAALSKDIPILLNHPVTKIRYNNSGVDVYANHEIFHSRAVIITVPIGVLRAGTIQFDPALPEEKQQAINNDRMGVFDKIYLHFTYPFWDKDKEWLEYVPATNSRIPPLDIMNYYKFGHIPVLLAFTAGDTAHRFEKMSDKQAVNQVMQQLKIMYGKNIPEPSSYVITHWENDPYSRGSYSYLPRGVPLTIYEELAKPVNNQLFFAGEGTSTTDPATVHGAYLSGIRAAGEVENLLNLK